MASRPRSRGDNATPNARTTVKFDTVRREHLFRHPPRDRSTYPMLHEVVRPQIEAFNAIFDHQRLIEQAIADIGTKRYRDSEFSQTEAHKNDLRVRFKSVSLQKPELPPSNKFVPAGKRQVYPWECRKRLAGYKGKLTATLEVSVNGGDWIEYERDLGKLPVMVMSNRCHLEGLSPGKLVDRMEESEEFGGYFIVNGREKLVRMLIMHRRNTPFAISRPSFANRGPGYTQYGVVMRCVRPDETSLTVTLHYLKDGNIIFRFAWHKSEYLVPVVLILKALIDTNDRDIFEGIVGPAGSSAAKDTALVDKVEVLLRTFKSYNLYSSSQARAYLGSKFRPVLGAPDAASDYELGTYFLQKIVLVHLGNVNVTYQQDYAKFRTLLFMCRKLYALAAGECASDNSDALSNQELLLGGFLYAQIIKERLEDLLEVELRRSLRMYFLNKKEITFMSPDFMQMFNREILGKMNENICQALEYFLSTGNLQSRSGLDLQQVSGFAIVAEKLNFQRFISHFRSVHRGAFFAQLRTTAIRKLLPESFGFMCPVHTPDGSPCGLLTHLSRSCKIVTKPVEVSAIRGLVAQFDVTDDSTSDTSEKVVIMLNGEVLGWCSPKVCKVVNDTLRHWKVEGTHGVPLELELGYIPRSNRGAYPGLYMASRASRMIRPVKYLALGKEDLIGPYEQPFMSVAYDASSVEQGVSTHMEWNATNFLSILASNTPFSNHNQSPRNMYQCQMSKQTMGTPGTALACRSDNKMYCITTPQVPVVRTPQYQEFGFDQFPSGTNVVVAVIAYTAYDMDDATVMNKSALERGLFHGSIFKTKQVTLKDTDGTKSTRTVTKLFGFAKGSIVKPEIREMLDDDGLPYRGRRLEKGDKLAAWHYVARDFSGHWVNEDGETHYETYKDDEVAYVDEVSLLGADTGTEPLQTISIKIRVPRAVSVGDKFSSRHGQKGVCSYRWPAVDMPFSETGIIPDVIINPHAFPSRMTIGMFVELLAGKSGALHGLCQDGSPFVFNEEHRADEYFGEQLKKAGFNWYGNEPMYSGMSGEEFRADIFLGVNYYQRLRHMVNDKYQVRSTGPVVPTTGQPVQGRKRGGGIRVGEMERDSLIAHGGAFLLQDRLLNCSDYTKSWICKPCGSFLSVQPTVSPYIGKRTKSTTARCRMCATRVEPGMDLSKLDGEMWEDGQGGQWIGGDRTTQVVVPGALKYLDVELAAMGIKLRYWVDDGHETMRGLARPIPLNSVEERFAARREKESDENEI